MDEYNLEIFKKVRFKNLTEKYKNGEIMVHV